MKKWIVGICMLIVLAVCFLGLDYWFGWVYVTGEINLSQEFIEEFDLSKLDAQRVYEYVKDNERYHPVEYTGSACRVVIPETEAYFMYETWIREYEVKEPYYELRWRFQLTPSRFADNWEDSVYFPNAYRSPFSCTVHILATGGDVNLYVYGNSIEECRTKAEAYLLEIYYDLLKSNEP